MTSLEMAKPSISMAIRREIPPDVSPSLRLDDVAAWRSCAERLSGLADLEDDWDGQGSPTPHSSAVRGAIDLLECLRWAGWPLPSRVFAGVNGTVIMEWHAANAFRELEVTGVRTFELTQRLGDGEPTFAVYRWADSSPPLLRF
jgi:hypothetical protein